MEEKILKILMKHLETAINLTDQYSENRRTGMIKDVWSTCKFDMILPSEFQISRKLVRFKRLLCKVKQKKFLHFLTVLRIFKISKDSVSLMLCQKS